MKILKIISFLAFIFCVIFFVEYYGHKKWTPKFMGIVNDRAGRVMIHGDTIVAKGRTVSELQYNKFTVFIYLSPSNDQLSRKYLMEKGMYSIYPDSLVERGY